MQPPANRAFVSHVLTPVAIVVVLTAVILAALLGWSTRSADRSSLERQRALVDLVLQQSVDRIAYDQESSTVWDDSVRRVTAAVPDIAWIDANLGSWFHSYYGHDEVHILGPDDRPIFSMQAGRRVSPAAFDAIRAQLLPMARELRTLRAPQRPRHLEVALLSPGVADIALVNGRPAIVSIKPIVSDTGDIAQTPGREALHASVRYLDGNFVQRLRDQYLFTGSRFSWTDRQGDGEASVPLVGRSGTVGYLIWKPFAPGSAIAGDLRPALLIALIVIGLVVTALMQRLRRRTIELQRSEAHAQHLALHDMLTGLPNRALFDQRLSEALRAMRVDRTSFALLCLDLDRFKQVNDTYGHPAGDELIREVGRRLSLAVRAGDTVARMGGDEFAIIQRGVHRPGEVELLCMRIVETLAQPFELASGQGFVGISIGVALAPQDGGDCTELIRKADIALYVAKRSGRGRYTFFAEEMDTYIQERQTLERQLRAALATHDQLEVVYQPVFATRTGDMKCVEALVRWAHPTKGLLVPERFVPLAEEAGLIEPLGEWVLETACRTARPWRIDRLAVNVSATQLRNPLFADIVKRILARTGFEAERLELEITESCFLDKDDDSRATIAALRAMGIRIALDDFGIGYSSLSHLRDFAVDRIKIDSSFVGAILPGAGGSAIIQAIIDLARASDLDVTAEGVETTDQLRFLSKVGCDELQGFLMSIPVRAEDIAQLLRPSATAPEASPPSAP
jgi:diguanylate cyclase (GGDEF)-like protein